MRAAPGAQLPIKEIFGRDAFIADLWHKLEVGSVRMEAERRIGKTSILNKMAAEPPAGWEVVAVDVEAVHSTSEFAEVVAKNVHERLALWSQTTRRIWEFLSNAGGTHLGPIKFPERKSQAEGYWKKLLQCAVEDLVEQQVAAKKRVVFFFDELPWMLEAISKGEGEQAAMHVLDVLRALRQDPATGQGFRMVVCGSVGLHHVLAGLRRQGYKNQPVNDMRLVEVRPLDPPAAAELAGKLLAGEGLTSDAGAAEVIAERTGGFPYYIHFVVSELRTGGHQVTPAEVERVVSRLLTDPQDPCQFQHFRGRIEGYYPQDSLHALALLDHAAASPGPHHQKDLIAVAQLAGAADDDRVRELLRLLAVDHYLDRDAAGGYFFRHALLRRWWTLERGL